MQDQPKYKPLRASTFFKDGISSRSLVEGTVPRGYLRADKALFTGQYDKAQATAAGQTQRGEGAAANTGAQPGGGQNMQNSNGGGNQSAQPSQPSGQPPATGTTPAQPPAGDANDVSEFPFPVTQEVVERGRERFEIFCAMCHGLTGEGDGMIVRRGYRKPPSYHEDRLRQARVGYFFRVMTEGFGAMPSYRAQVPVQDRWAIIAYIRALQLSQMNQTSAPAAATPAQGGANTEGGGHQ
jgi:mono/diheme cytochrome c family protein